MIRCKKAAFRANMFGGLLLLSASFVALMTSVVVSAREAQASKPLPTVSASALPKQAQDMIALIRQGGPFRYKQDGVTFGNREKRLPAQPRGFYREYTVKTPGSRDRGARRIVCGGAQQTSCYYTDDHYASFRKITE